MNNKVLQSNCSKLEKQVDKLKKENLDYEAIVKQVQMEKD